MKNSSKMFTIALFLSFLTACNFTVQRVDIVDVLKSEKKYALGEKIQLVGIPHPNTKTSPLK